MLLDVIAVRTTYPYSLHLMFEDGLEGTVSLDQIMPFDGVFAPLKDPAYFSQVTVNGEIGTVVWPNGADLAPDALYDLIAAKH